MSSTSAMSHEHTMRGVDDDKDEQHEDGGGIPTRCSSCIVRFMATSHESDDAGLKGLAVGGGVPHPVLVRVVHGLNVEIGVGGDQDEQHKRDEPRAHDARGGRRRGRVQAQEVQRALEALDLRQRPSAAACKARRRGRRVARQMGEESAAQLCDAGELGRKGWRICGTQDLSCVSLPLTSKPGALFSEPHSKLTQAHLRRPFPARAQHVAEPHSLQHP